jgi:tripartite-type tricarboxylate transporter receptor subunit TctC
LPHVQTGRLKLLATSTAKRSPEHPNTPTLIESGVPGMEFTSWLGLLAPAGTPHAILERLSGDIMQVLNAPDLQQQFVKDGIKFHASTPAEFASFIESETTRFRKLVKDSGISLD